MKSRQGIALVTILIVAATVLAILATGLKLGNSGVLFVSQVHRRNVAIAAAEAGVFEVMRELESQRDFSSQVSGTLSESGGTYQAEVSNELSITGRVQVVSTGRSGSVSRTLKVELEPDSTAFAAIGVEGKVYIYDQAYVNGISSASDPVVRPGHAHSNFNEDSKAAFEGRNFFSDDNTVAGFHATGDISSQAIMAPTHLDTVQNNLKTGLRKDLYSLNKDTMLAGSPFPLVTFNGGTLSQSIQVDGDTDFDQFKIFSTEVVVPKGLTLHVQGSAEFRGGLSGEGQVVVEGNTIILTSGNFDPSISEGIKLFSGLSVVLMHPTTELDVSRNATDNINKIELDIEMDPLGNYLAQMPPAAFYEILNNIPTDAPQGSSFFSWFQNETPGQNEDFDLWLNGDDSDLYPGLSPETVEWLENSQGVPF